MRTFIPLTKLSLNKKATIQSLHCEGPTHRRLLDLGLVKGAVITPVLTSPSKGLRAFDILGTLIAIRDEDASYIIVSYK